MQALVIACPLYAAPVSRGDAWRGVEIRRKLIFLGRNRSSLKAIISLVATLAPRA